MISQTQCKTLSYSVLYYFEGVQVIHKLQIIFIAKQSKFENALYPHVFLKRKSNGSPQHFIFIKSTLAVLEIIFADICDVLLQRECDGLAQHLLLIDIKLFGHLHFLEI